MKTKIYKSKHAMGMGVIAFQPGAASSQSKFPSALRRLVKSENIIINIPGGSTATRFMFPDLPNLRNVHLWSLECYYRVTLPKSINNIDTPTLQMVQQSFLTLEAYNGKEFCHQLPVINILNQDTAILVPLLGNADRQQTSFPTLFAGQKCNYPKSYIEFASNAVIPPLATTFTFVAYYTEARAIESKDAQSDFRNQS